MIGFADSDKTLRLKNLVVPIRPLSEKAVSLHYLPGQTWTSVFGKLVGTVEEFRAILVSEYFMDNKELLRIFGYTDTSEIIA